MDAQNTLELKRLFAIAILREPENPFKAALTIAGADTGRAMQIAMQWPSDPEVIDLKDRLIADHGEKAFLPSKEELARKVIAFAEERNSNGFPLHDSKERIAAYRLYGDIMGYIEKPGLNVDARQQTFNTQHVMVVTDHGNDDAWETKCEAQQRRLTSEAAN